MRIVVAKESRMSRAFFLPLQQESLKPCVGNLRDEALAQEI